MLTVQTERGSLSRLAGLARCKNKAHEAGLQGKPAGLAGWACWAGSVARLAGQARCLPAYKTLQAIL